MKFTAIFALSLFFLLAIVAPLATAQESDCELKIRGGIGSITFFIDNQKDTPVDVYIRITVHNYLEEISIEAQAHQSLVLTKEIYGFGLIIVQMSAAGNTVTRAGVGLGLLILFLTPPYL